MSHYYSDLISDAKFHDGTLSVAVPDAWTQGRTILGGLSAALCWETAQRAFENLPPLRTAMVSFIGPALGDVEGRATILRQGKSVTFVEAGLFGQKGLATRVVFSFGAERQSAFDRTFTPAPAVPAPEDCERYIPEGLGPPFVPPFCERFETNLAKGARAYTGSDEYDHFIWVRHKDSIEDSLGALLALGDRPPPAILSMADGPLSLSSMNWMVNVLSDKPQTRDGWWLLQTRAENAAHGYTSQDMLIWNRDMELVVAGRQCVAVFG